MTAAVVPRRKHDVLLDDAEDALQRGCVADASSLARTVLQQKAAPVPDKARAISLLIQADFHFHNKLTDIIQLLKESGLQLQQLPVTAVLLWGVVAVELEAATAARALLSDYLSCKDFGPRTDVSREDALALSRLYAVQLLSGLCQDFQAAADWLQEGGVGLSEEQRELLLLEVDEAEEVAQEQQVAVWTSQDAAAVVRAARLGEYDPAAAAGIAAEAADAASDVALDCGTTVSSASAVGSLASTAVAALHDLGPSVSGVLSSSSLHPAGESSHEHEHEHEAASHEHEHGHEVDAPPSRSLGAINSSSMGQVRPTPAAAAAAAGAQLEAAVAAVAAAHARLGGAAAAQSPTAGVLVSPAVISTLVAADDRTPSSPSLASWRAPPDEAAVLDQGSQADTADSPFVTITGAFNDAGYDAAAVAAVVADVTAAGGAVGLKGAGCVSGSSSPRKGGKVQQQDDGSSKTGGRAVHASAVQAAPVVSAAVAAPGLLTQQQQQQQQQQPEQQEQRQELEQQAQQQSWLGSYASWASSKASEVWQSHAVQDTLTALNLQDVPPWQLAGGAAAAALLAYGLLRNRRRVRRAAADAAAGAIDTARMAVGLSGPINPMAAVPASLMPR